MSNIYWNLIEHEYKLKRLEANVKKKERVKEKKISISLKVSTFKTKVEEDKDCINKHSLEEE